MLESNKFRLNGTANPIDEPYPFLDQLHGVLCCIDLSLRDEDGDGIPNVDILRSAIKGAATLAHLAAQSLQFMDDHRREAGHA